MSDTSYTWARNGMGDYTTGTGMREDMLMQAFNIWAYQAGVFGASDLVITQRAAGANMSVDVSAGRCLIQNSAYVANTANSTKYWGETFVDATNIPIDTNTSGSTRIDKICVKFDTVADPGDYAALIATRVVVKGTPGAGAPATPSNHLLLGYLTIPTGTTVSILTAMITDSRVFSGFTLETGSPFYLGTAITYAGTDLDLEPAGGDVRLRNGTRLQVFNSGNTESLTITVGTNTEMLITTGNLHVYDTDHDVHLRIYADDLGADYVDIWHDGTNGNLETGSGDLLIEPSGGDVMFRSGTDVRVYNAANTQYGLNAMGTNWDFSTTSGEITMNPFATFRVTAGSDIVFTPTGDVYITAGTSLIMRNPTDTAATELYTDVNNDFYMDPQADGDVIVFGKMPRDNSGSATYVNSTIQSGWGFIPGIGSPVQGETVTFTKPFSSDNVRVVVQIAGMLGGADPADEGDLTLSDTGFCAMASDVTATTFRVDIYNVVGGLLTAGERFGYSWIAIGPA